jgi:hypothetical protein
MATEPSAFCTSQVQPEPKLLIAAFSELLLEVCEGAESAADGVRQGAGRLAAAVRGQAVPVESVVPDLRRVVEDTALGVRDDIFQGGVFAMSVPASRPFSLST